MVLGRFLPEISIISIVSLACTDASRFLGSIWEAAEAKTALLKIAEARIGHVRFLSYGEDPVAARAVRIAVRANAKDQALFDREGMGPGDAYRGLRLLAMECREKIRQAQTDELRDHAGRK
jgi:hypothetical protein